MADNGRPPPGEGRQAVVVGCGPTGSLMALYLAKLGFKVAAYEKRADYKTRSAKGGIDQKAYDIFLNPRGLGALRDAGMEIGDGVGVVLEGALLRGGRREEKLKFATPLTVVNRDALSNALQEEGLRALPGRIEFFFEHRLVGVDFEGKMAVFDGVGARVEKGYDLLVGADGVWSGVRGEMEKGGLVEVRQVRNGGGIRMMGIMDDLPGCKDPDWGRYWHLWLKNGPGLVMGVTPTPDGRFRAGFAVMSDRDRDQILNLRSEARLEEILRRRFPGLFAGQKMPEGLARNLVEQDANHNGVETLCSAFHAENSVVLVGDSAHSVWANQGQGCNLALESCGVLAGLMEEHGGDLSKALPAFTVARKPETDAAAILSRRRFISIRSIVKQRVVDWLHRLLPFAFSESALTGLIKGERPYTALLPMERRQNRQLVLLAGVAGLLAFALRR
eukprot:evm.model.scf_783.1 EVM.evm.TU.scf_783.1   scf_783:350-1687(+)